MKGMCSTSLGQLVVNSMIRSRYGCQQMRGHLQSMRHYAVNWDATVRDMICKKRKLNMSNIYLSCFAFHAQRSRSYITQVKILFQ